jgi:hypothetical protein
MNSDFRRFGLFVAVVLALSPVFAVMSKGAASKKLKIETFKGKVVPLAKLLEKFGSRLDPDAAPHWLALITDEGKVYPLIKDDGSRLFFADPKLLNRPMELKGQLFKNTHLLQVLAVHSIIKGKLHEVYYWCDICSIKRNQKQICDCCGGPMVLKEVPVKK